MKNCGINVKVLQVILLLITSMGAIYFGIMQTIVNSKLAKIESYKYEQTILKENAEIIKSTKEMRKITIEIADIFTDMYSGVDTPLNEKSRKEILLLTRHLYSLLYEGVDNYLLVNNEEAFYIWLGAINKIEYIQEMPLNIHLVGSTIDSTGQKKTDEKSVNESWDKIMIKSIEEVFPLVMQVHSLLGLSLAKSYNEMTLERVEENIIDSLKQ